MPFISFLFLFLFLPISLVFHFLATRFGERARLCSLIVVSFAFFMSWEMRAAALLACSIMVNYGVGFLLEQAHKKARALQSKILLAAGVVFNLGALAVFRYGHFLADDISTFWGATFVIHNIVAPLGVLFFSCDQIAYLADIARGKRYEASFLRYAAFASFFPRLVAGPLLRYEQIWPQWEQHKPDIEDIAIGMTTFVIGMAKVVLLAASVAPFATLVFAAASAGQSIEFVAAWVGVLAFAAQIYFDLSGYADMAIGLGRCFGLVLPTNFRSPYRAANIADFWLRWNITLTDFLRDYIYVPLGGNRHGIIHAMFNLMVAMLLGGLWYGAGGMFVAWALLQAFYIVFHRAWRAFCVHSQAISRFRTTKIARAIGVALTFLAVTLGWAVFRSANPAAALNLLAALSGQYGAVLPAGFASVLGPILPLAHDIGIGFAPTDDWSLLPPILFVTFCFGVIFLLPTTETLLSAWRPVPEDEDRMRKKLFPLRWMASPAWSAALGALAFVCLISWSSASAYLHWRF